MFIIALLFWGGLAFFFSGDPWEYLAGQAERVRQNAFLSKFDLILIWEYKRFELFSYLTLSLENQIFKQAENYGWLLINFMIHFLNFGFLFEAAKQYPQFSGANKIKPSADPSCLMLFFISFFLFHPAGGSQVFSILGRQALWTGFFYWGTLIFYWRGRIKREILSLWLSAAILCLGALTHPLAAGAVIVIALSEIFFFPRSSLSRKYLLPFSIGMVGVFLAYLFLFNSSLNLPLESQREALDLRRLITAHLLKESLKGFFFIFENLESYRAKDIWAVGFYALAVLGVILMAKAFEIRLKLKKGWFGIRQDLFFLFWFVTVILFFPFLKAQDLACSLYLLTSFFSFCLAVFLCSLTPGNKTLTAFLFLLLVLNIQETQQRRDYQKDPELFLQARIRNNPLHPKRYMDLSFYYLRGDQWHKAKNEAGKAIDLRPDSIEIYKKVSEVYLSRRAADVEAFFKPLHSVYPLDEDIKIILARAYLRSNQDTLAGEILNNMRVHHIHQKSTLALAKGEYYEKTGNWGKAKLFYAQSLFFNPGDVRLYLNLGNCFFQLGDFRTAFFYYNESVVLDPRYASGYHNLGHIFFHFQDFRKAAEMYRKSIEIKPSFAQGYLSLANALFALGKKQESKVFVKKAARLFQKSEREKMSEEILKKIP